VELPSGAAFCPKCGGKVSNALPVLTTTKQEDKKSMPDALSSAASPEPVSRLPFGRGGGVI
jgi:hypothetical protein